MSSHPAADALRRRVQSALPYGAAARVAIRSGRSERCVHGQIEGEHPLTVAVAVEALRELPPALARTALDELLAPAGLAVVTRPGAPGAVSVGAANAGLLSAVGALEASVGDAMADGKVSQPEALRIVAALSDARARLEALLSAVMG